VLAVLALGLSGDGADLLGAVFGLAVVLVFYGTDLLVLWVARRLAPAATMGLFLGEYLVKVLAIATVLWAMRDSSAVDLEATALTVVVTTVAWVAALTTAALRTRSFVLDPTTEAVPSDVGDTTE
jgi:ATP synthase protein I